MLTRQPVCENEIVPSLHSNLGDAASATGAGLAATAACCGAGACATGFSNEEAQPAHQTESNKTRSIRICISVRKATPAGPTRLARSAANDQPVSCLSIQRTGMIRT